MSVSDIEATLRAIRSTLAIMGIIMVSVGLICMIAGAIWLGDNWIYLGCFALGGGLFFLIFVAVETIRLNKKK